MPEARKKSVLVISKPLIPPWNDSSKNLAMGIVNYARQTRFHVFSTPGTDYHSDRIIGEPIYRNAGSYSPSLSQNLRVFRRILGPDRNIETYHFFFAPNPRTSTICRLATRWKKPRTIQTVCSPPRDYTNLSRLIFTDWTVVLSDYHLKIFSRAGIENVVRIYPGVEIPEKISLPANHLRERLGITDEKVILYPGDYEFSGGHEILLEILPRLAKEFKRIKIIFACRPKTPESKKIEAAVTQRIREIGCEEEAIFLSQVDNMAELYDLTSICLFPARSLYKKMDLPLTLLECLAREIPLIVGDFAPLNEVLIGGGGIAVRPDSPDSILDALRRLLSDRELRTRYGRDGRASAHRNFDIKIIARKYEELYQV